MTALLRERLRNQRLVGSDRFGAAEHAVAWLGAVQAQDFAGAKWSIGLRARELTDRDVQMAFDAGRLLRTHVLRPTWHFVTRRDIRWMLELTAPRVNMLSAHQCRQHELDGPLFAKSRSVFERALRDGNHLTRLELSSVLREAHILATGQRLAQIVMRAELDGLICSGPRRGNQFTYALVAERAPRTPTLPRDEALATLTLRYFSSHGPATLHDFTWWSSLTMKDARDGVAMNGAGLIERRIDGRSYWMASAHSTFEGSAPKLHLLPTYDEYVVAYRNRDNFMDQRSSRRIAVRENYGQWLVVDGRVKGSWKRTFGSAGAILQIRPIGRLSSSEAAAITAAARRYARFLELPVSVATSR